MLVKKLHVCTSPNIYFHESKHKVFMAYSISKVKKVDSSQIILCYLPILLCTATLWLTVVATPHNWAKLQLIKRPSAKTNKNGLRRIILLHFLYVFVGKDVRFYPRYSQSKPTNLVK